MTLFLHTSVTDLVPNDAYQCVEHVEVRRDDGSRFFVRARIVVLAGGGIENPRLLLLGQLARGRALGNDHDLVGRFAERISAGSGFVVAARPETVERAGFYNSHAAKGTHVQGALRVADKVQRERDLLNVVFFLLARPAPVMSPAIRSIATLAKGTVRRPLLIDLPAHLGNVAAGLGDVAAMVRTYLRRGGAPAGRVLMMRVQGEQAPNPNSRVTLGWRRDRFGLPVARIDWRPSAGVRESIRASQEVISAGLQAARLGHVKSMLGDEHPPALFEGNFHHLGTPGCTRTLSRVWWTSTAASTASTIFTLRAAQCSRPTGPPTRR